MKSYSVNIRVSEKAYRAGVMQGFDTEVMVDDEHPINKAIFAWYDYLVENKKINLSIDEFGELAVTCEYHYSEIFHNRSE